MDLRSQSKPRMFDRTVFQSTEDGDRMVLSDMESGATESNDGFAELVEKKA